MYLGLQVVSLQLPTSEVPTPEYLLAELIICLRDHPVIDLFDLMATGRSSSAVINKSGESGAPCWLPRSAATASSLSPLWLSHMWAGYRCFASRDQAAVGVSTFWTFQS